VGGSTFRLAVQLVKIQDFKRRQALYENCDQWRAFGKTAIRKIYEQRHHDLNWFGAVMEYLAKVLDNIVWHFLFFFCNFT
jgi:hypothetical protein